MPARLRPRREPTDDWQQLRLLSQFPEQLTYELIRPVVLFDHSPPECAQQTGAPARTLYRQAARFEREGMASIFDPPPRARPSFLPAEIRDAIHPRCHTPKNRLKTRDGLTAAARCPRRRAWAPVLDCPAIVMPSGTGSHRRQSAVPSGTCGVGGAERGSRGTEDTVRLGVCPSSRKRSIP